MFDWLFEGKPAVYALLATVGVLFAGLWWRDRKRHWLIGVGVGVVLIGAYFLLDRLVETGREQIPRSVEAMVRGVKERKPADVLAHVSDRFEMEGADKKTFGEALEARLREPVVDDLLPSKIDFVKWPPDQGKPAVAVFTVNAKGARVAGERADVLVRCEAEFVRDPDGRWRMKGLKVFFPVTSDTPISLRGYLR